MGWTMIGIEDSEFTDKGILVPGIDWTIIKTYPVEEGKTIYFDFNLVAKQVDELHYGGFMLIGLVANKSGLVELISAYPGMPATWDTPSARSTHTRLGAIAEVSPAGVILKVRNATGPTKWNVRVETTTVK